jgi:2-polyprenyl-6-methoxyphenol hydroxylase-like FAD-dependent oxidoreductase
MPISGRAPSPLAMAGQVIAGGIMDPVRKLLIVGGGIAGLSAAIAARQAGVEVDLIEADPAWAAVGVGLIFQPSALRAVARLGVVDEVLAQGFGYGGARLIDAEGRVLSETTDGPRLAGADRPSAAGVPRPALASILKARAAGLGARTQAGTTVRGLTLGSDHVDVRFSDGRFCRYDLVVGADGIYSSIRRMAFDFTLAPEFTGQGVWRFTTTRPAEVERAWLCRGPHGSAGLIPLSRETMYLFLVENGVAADRRLAHEDLVPALAALLAPFGGPIGEIAARLGPDSDVVYRPFEWAITPAPWHRGRVLLIGDAAHASTAHLGAGGGMAIEDAVVLGELLAARMAPEQMLRAFMARRYDRCMLVARNSHLLGEIEQGKVSGVDPGRIAGEVFAALAEPI